MFSTKQTTLPSSNQAYVAVNLGFIYSYRPK